MFCFSIPEAGLWSGPFRDANADATVNGSADKAHFLHLFEELYKFALKNIGEKLKRAGPLTIGSMPVADDGAATLEAAGLKSLIGQEVRLVGLQSKPDLNGAVGVCERFDGRQARYAIRLPGHETPIGVKAANLELVERTDKDEL